MKEAQYVGKDEAIAQKTIDVIKKDMHYRSVLKTCELKKSDGIVTPLGFYVYLEGEREYVLSAAEFLRGAWLVLKDKTPLHVAGPELEAPKGTRDSTSDVVNGDDYPTKFEELKDIIGLAVVAHDENGATKQEIKDMVGWVVASHGWSLDDYNKRDSLDALQAEVDQLVENHNQFTGNVDVLSEQIDAVCFNHGWTREDFEDVTRSLDPDEAPDTELEAALRRDHKLQEEKINSQ